MLSGLQHNQHTPAGERQIMRGSCAFTLIELLVTVAIIGILAGLLLPSLAAAKRRSQGIYCMNNSKQLALSLSLYASDFHELYPPNPDDNTTMAGYNWCPGSVRGGMPGVPPGADTFNPDLLLNEKKTLIIPYSQFIANISDLG
jgi:prepilin-type N-terminal cleavage/methylation domain-containing protein